MSPEKKRKKKGRPKGEGRANKFTELFEEEERQGENEDESQQDEALSEEEAPRKEGVALFDTDLYGRRVGDAHAAGFGKTRNQGRHLTSKGEGGESEASGGSDEDDMEEEPETYTDEEDEADEDELLAASLYNEWDLLALEKARKAMDDGYGYFGDAFGNQRPRAALPTENPDLLVRLWESSFFITAFQNIEMKAHYFFYVVTFGHINKERKITGELRRRVLYSPGFAIKPGEYRALPAPFPVWPKKSLPISYSGLASYAITIDLWQISDYTFNTLYASATLSLRDLVDMNPDVTILLQRRLPDKKKSYEVQRIKATIQIAEVFDFDMFFESWSFNPSPFTARALAQVPKLLQFIMPKGGGKGWRVKWTEESLNGFWVSPFTFTYTGTTQELQNAYFIVKVFVRTEKRFFERSQLVGSSIMSLRSVTTYPLFKSMVKRLTVNAERFNQGEIFGNIRCFARSAGLPFEDPAVIKRPEQPLAGAALVTQLDLKEQFLVVRLFKCESLPAANADAGTSDPVVKVTWDAMTNQSVVRQNTLRPVYNQNLYFPIRLLDPSERTNVAYIQNCLPADLLSKGKVVFEVWNQDETAGDFLGGCEVHLSEITAKGRLQTRKLAEGLEQADSDAARLPDGRPAAFQYRGAEEIDIERMGKETRSGFIQPYEKQYETRVFSGNGIGKTIFSNASFVTELTGATIGGLSGVKPLIFFEIFCIPPLPSQLELPTPPPVKEEQDLWKQWTKRWNRDFAKWQRAYRDMFPAASSERRFLCTAEHPQTRHLFPLPAFVTPVAVPEQVSQEGELLHWITNMSFTYSSQQLRTGQITRWLSPNYFLIARKGGVNDHAVLLCSCLLGLDYDAYVCKGTINNGKDEHFWVMTRHRDNWIVFWETTSKKRYHLPARWGYPRTTTLEPPTPEMTVNFDKNENSQYYTGSYLHAWYAQAAAQCGFIAQPLETDEAALGRAFGEDVVPDIRLADEQVVHEAYEKQTGERDIAADTDMRFESIEMQKWLEQQIDNIPIAPRKALVDLNTTLCYVPYSSIEVVFNAEQLWGNLQNHHPACITYDMDDPWMWRPFLTERPAPIDNLIFVAPSTRDRACQVRRDEIQADIGENICVYRGKRGLETQLDHADSRADRLEKFLDLLEYRLRLDPDFDPGPPPEHAGWSSWGLFESVENTQDYSTTWYQNLQQDPAKLTLYPGGASAEQGEGVAEPSQIGSGQAVQEVRQEFLQNQPAQLLRVPQKSSPGILRSKKAKGETVRFQSVAVHGATNPTTTPSQEESSSMKEPSQKDKQSKNLCRGVSRSGTMKGNSPATFLTAARFFGDEVKDQKMTAETSESAAQESDEEEESETDEKESDNEQVLRYCKLKNVQLATRVLSTPSTPDESHTATPSSLFDRAVGEPASIAKQVRDVLQVKATQPPSPFILRKRTADEDSSTEAFANELSSDSFWEQFELEFESIKKDFVEDPSCGMNFDDYDAFERQQQEKKMAATQDYRNPPMASPSEKPLSSKARETFASQPQDETDESLYKLLERPIEEKESEKLGDFDVSVLGFKRAAPLEETGISGAIKLPPKEGDIERAKQRKAKEAEAKAAAKEGAGTADVPIPPKIFRRPVISADYQKSQTAKWNRYYRMENLYYRWQKVQFPVKPSHTFCGFPIHFSTTDASLIRTFLLSSRRFRKVMEIPVDGVTYVIRSKVYPLMGGVVSVWVFIGCEIHWAGKRERQTRMRRRAKPKHKPNKAILQT